MVISLCELEERQSISICAVLKPVAASCDCAMRKGIAAEVKRYATAFGWAQGLIPVRLTLFCGVALFAANFFKD